MNGEPTADARASSVTTGTGDTASAHDAAHERKRFDRAVVWNLGSLVVLGVSGILLNVLIGRLYDEATLGVFNQALAAYIFFSQLAVGGVNSSVLRAVAEQHGHKERVTGIVVGAFALTGCLAAGTTALYVLSSGAIARWLDSPATATGIVASAPGLFFFALNKVGLGVVNGVQRMRAFAVYTALRYFLILVALLGFLVLDTERRHGAHLAFVFSFSEGVLFLFLAVEVLRQIARPILPVWRAWARTHLVYGVKSMASGVLLELNARVDVLMIGHFMSDAFVGIYTVAAMIAEGVYQLLVVLQNMYNPILARELAARRLEELRATIRKARVRTYAAMLGVGAVAVLAYPHVVRSMMGEGGASDLDYSQSWEPFAWLMLGIWLASGYIPFAQTLLMANQPAWHTLYMVLAVLFNVIGNWFLIPIWGLAGAAISTANAMFLSVFVLKALVRARTSLKL
jgi:stage V sporulation protein B